MTEPEFVPDIKTLLYVRNHFKKKLVELDTNDFRLSDGSKAAPAAKQIGKAFLEAIIEYLNAEVADNVGH